MWVAEHGPDVPEVKWTAPSHGPGYVYSPPPSGYRTSEPVRLTNEVIEEYTRHTGWYTWWFCNLPDMFGVCRAKEVEHLRQLVTLDHDFYFHNFHNMIGSIPTEIGLLTHLDHLDLSANSLTSTLPTCAQ